MKTNHRKNGTFRKGNAAGLRGPAPADTQLQIRVPTETKGRWAAAAQARGLTLSAWVTQAPNRAALMPPKS